ncbi:MAG: ABC transporter ATP-binding protein [Planctomycetota bacterium]|nr:MAG: ABC transporter ATP-binding protein [Planctomycetota bacterium]
MSTSPLGQSVRVPGVVAARRGIKIDKRAARSAFWRMLRLVRPHRRAMTLGILLGMFVAMTYAASLAGILPVLKVIVEQENLRTWMTGQAEHLRGVEAWYGPWIAGVLADGIGTLAQALPAANTAAARMQSLLTVLALLIGVNLIGNTARVFSQYLVLFASHRVVMDLRRKMYRKALHVPMNELLGDVSARVSQFMTDVREVFLGLGTLFGKVAREPLKAICVLVVALWMDARLTLVVLAIGPPAVLGFWIVGRKIRKATVRLLEGYAQMLGRLEEALQGVDVVKGHNREGYERREMWRLERRMMRQQLKLVWIEAITSPAMELLGLLAASGGIVWLASRTFSGEISPGHFITMVVLLAAMLDPLRKIANVYNSVQRSGAAALRIFAFLDQPEEHSPPNALTLPPATGGREVRFHNVSFSYSPDQTPPALADVSLEVSRGECVVLVGPNGSGKSTLLRALPRLLDPTQGSITIDGIDVSRLSLRNLRGEIAIVSQRPVIFARSVADNLRYAKPDATDEEIREAARRAFAAEFIETWPDKYETVIGEFGTSMSGGQRQRIAIARAFLKPASILVFDEATSEIDADSERKIHEALNVLRQGKTTFLIAHRHTVMDMADRIVVMDAGRIVDVGTQAELLERCPLFVALYRSPAAR